MPVTRAQVEQLLNVDEPDYAAGWRLGANALPHLLAMVREGNPGLAAKAIYLATRIGGDGATAVIDAGASHADPVPRVAAAAALGSVPAGQRGDISVRLLADRDQGVRQRTLSALPQLADPALRQRFADLADSLPEGQHKQDVLEAGRRASGSEPP
ncbi:MAG: hypothetical protein WKG03_13345 [Telluria sp.]